MDRNVKEINSDVENPAVEKIDRYVKEINSNSDVENPAVEKIDRYVKEINSDVENPAVEKIDRTVVERGNSVARTGMSARKPKDDEHNWITDMKKVFDVLQRKIFDVHRGPYLERWSSVFVISCVFAVSLDPLFFYVVNIDQKNKCLECDKTLKIVAFVMRSLTDVIFLMHLICEILDSVQKTMDNKSGTSASETNTSKNEPSEESEQTRGNFGNKGENRELTQYAGKIAHNVWLSIIIDVLALLPLPQLIILMFYPMKNSGFVEHKKFLNVFLLGQYVPRIFRIHLSAKVFKKKHGIWAKGLFNLFLYILAGHVLGAFWYFFSIQREASCLDEACGKLRDVCKGTLCFGCKDILYCDSGNTIERYFSNYANESCSLDTPYVENKSCPLRPQDDRNTTARNFIKHLNKYCPLHTPDDDTPDDGALSPFNFGIFLDSLKNENPKQKFGKKFLYSFWWGLRNLSNFGTNLVTSMYVWENSLAILISVIGLLLFIYLIGNVQAFMLMGATKTVRLKRQRKKQKESIETLKKIPMLKDMDEERLKMMCDYLKPATYEENSFVFRTGDPLDCMLLIIEGTMWTYASSDSHVGQGISSMAIKPLRKGDFYGEELLDRVSNCFTEVPVSSKHVKSQTKVEAFLLMAKDLETVWDHFNNRDVEELKKC